MGFRTYPDPVGNLNDAANASGSVLARLAELLTNRLTAARAGYLDRLDAAISSRASGADYTAARAAKLDYLNNYISTILDHLYSGTKQYSNIRATSLPVGDTVVLTVNGSGYLHGFCGLGSYSLNSFSIIIDGLTVFSSTNLAITNLAFFWRFTSSFSIKVNINTSPGEFRVDVYYRTGV